MLLFGGIVFIYKEYNLTRFNHQKKLLMGVDVDVNPSTLDFVGGFPKFGLP